MKTAIVTFLSIFMLLSCHNDDSNNDDSFIPRDITPVVIGKGDLSGTGRENISPQRITIYENEDWNTIINSIEEYYLEEEFTDTNVNFNEFQLIAAFDNIHANKGYNIDITGITENSNNIVVTIQTSYTPSFINYATQPFHIVKIPKSNKPVVFQ